MGLSSNKFCLNGLAGGHRGGLCTILSLHTSTLSLGVWQGVCVARVFRAQLASQVSKQSFFHAQKRAAKILRHMWKARLGSRDKVLLICSLSDMMRNTYDVIYDVVYDIVTT